ncbi:hypothetical protein [Polaromonas sp. UC242_47]|uniref:hypothetical protein n=1 Tax=Polaromonas sp. UC242_47 TaxID=3374626 RepID=UPI0037B17ADB
MNNRSEQLQPVVLTRNRMSTELTELQLQEAKKLAASLGCVEADREYPQVVASLMQALAINFSALQISK